MLKLKWQEILGDKHNLEIMSLLVDEEQRNLYTISRESRIYPKTANAHLRNLMKLGLVEAESVGGIRLYRIRNELFTEEVLLLLRWLKSQRT